ncbi:MAG: M20/M25/M40 family metallo-hydrolase [Chloroflexota bacterium]|nr:M20/M25/M40 family metallo-hydrolase [Chloroflexota bacterium]MDE2908626.1 M20/M25/M40 family metallo-hydrolase [Chloroflexota bacterium]
MTDTAIAPALEHSRRRREHNLEGFRTLLRFPSISLEPAFQPQLRACADWILADMERIGLRNCQKLGTAGNPVLYADWLRAGPDAPTILFYAHYDVQPVGDASLWQTPPFEPATIGDRLAARGAVDDKCGIWINLKAIEAILAACGGLPINVKLFFEGEEELGSKNTAPFVAAHKDLLAADALIISDGPFSPVQPVIGNAVRGSIMGEARVQGPPHELHSGRYGGAVKNPIHYLARIIASLHDENGRLRIRGFYDDIIPLSHRQIQHLNTLWKTIGPPLQGSAGVEAFFGDSNGVFAERSTSQPTLDVSGVFGGPPAAETRAIIPAQAGFKVTIRTVAGQDSEAMWRRFVEHVTAFAEPAISIETELFSIAHPFLMPDDGREIRAIQRALKAALGREALLMRHGGSLAIGGLLGRELGLPVTMFGYGSGGNSHAPNEFITVDDIQIATEVAIRLLFELGLEQ